MVRRWVHPSEWPTPDSPAEDPSEVSADEIADDWRPIVESAQAGKRDDAKRLFYELCEFLLGRASWRNAVVYSPEARKFLAGQLGAGLNVPSRDVGKAMGIGLSKGGRRKSKYDALHKRFENWYLTRMRELELTSERELPRDEVDGWVNANAEGTEDDVDQKTLDGWIDQARERLFISEVFADVPRPASS